MTFRAEITQSVFSSINREEAETVARIEIGKKSLFIQLLFFIILLLLIAAAAAAVAHTQRSRYIESKKQQQLGICLA